MAHIRVIFLLSVLFSFSSGIFAQGARENRTAAYPRDSREGIEELYRRYPAKETHRKLSVGLDTTSREKWENWWFYVEEGSIKEVNFGGKYIIIQWGCGTSCQTGAMIDAETGGVYLLPTSEWGKEFRENSFLLIVNPPEEIGETGSGDQEENRPEWAYPAYYVWKDGAFQLLKDTRE